MEQRATAPKITVNMNRNIFFTIQTNYQFQKFQDSPNWKVPGLIG